MLQPSWNSRVTNGDASDGLIKKRINNVSNHCNAEEKKQI